MGGLKTDMKFCFRRLVFAQQSAEDESCGRTVTSGIDIYVTGHRILLLDCQPTLAAHLPSTSGRCQVEMTACSSNKLLSTAYVRLETVSIAKGVRLSTKKVFK